MQMKRIKQIQYLEVTFENSGRTVQGFTTRHEGVSRAPYNSLNLGSNTLDQLHNVEGNRNLLARALDLHPDAFVTVQQTHGTDILVIDEENKDCSHFLGIEADAIMTNQPGILIGVTVADCAPILIYDPVKSVVAAVHAGWQGTANKLASKTIQGMSAIFGSKPQNLYVAIGPCIGKCCYEVDTPVRKGFEQNGWKWELFAELRQGGHWQLDLTAANRELMINNGVSEENIQTSDYCVSCQRELFFSYRRDEGETGRQMGFIMLKGI